MMIEPLEVQGAFRLVPQLIEDDRGFFARRFCAETFAQHGLETDFVQRSISFNHKRGTVRGLHFQAPPYAETKIVRCTRGAAFDVLVDLRPGSPTFRRWHGETLTERNHNALYVPQGFAHGFQTLEDETEIDYEITPGYMPDAARGVVFDDPDLDIDWPVPDSLSSNRDRGLPRLKDVRLVRCFKS